MYMVQFDSSIREIEPAMIQLRSTRKELAAQPPRTYAVPSTADAVARSIHSPVKLVGAGEPHVRRCLSQFARSRS
jgi:hypothetical protein